MRIQIQCRQCFEAGLLADTGKKVPYIPTYSHWNYPVVQIDKWPYFEMECPNGHKHRYTMSSELFEVLFQQATYCLQDGYYREAIGTYHASLERLFEYCIEILCYHTGITEGYQQIWKQVKKQSERQLGAFYFIWYTTLGELPDFLNENKVRLRNDVVHNGKLATEQEAQEYGAYVFEYIRKTISKLKFLLGDDLRKYEMIRHYRICEGDLKKALSDPVVFDVGGEKLIEGIGCVSIPTFISNIEKYPTYESCFDESRNDTNGFFR